MDNKSKASAFFGKYAIYFIFVFLFLLVSVINPRFLSVRVIKDVLMQSSVKLIVALGMMFVILSGNIDLSGGRVLGFAAVVAGSLAQTGDFARKFYPNLPEVPFFVPVIAAILLAMTFALVNGLVITRLGVAAFIATLGTQLAAYGLNSIYYNQEPNNSQPIGGFKKSFSFLGTGQIAGFFPCVLAISLVCAAIVHIVMRYHKFGRLVFAVGGNSEAAIVSGINTKKVILTVYLIAGFFFGLGGALEAARTGGAQNNYGLSYEFDAISACTVGGVSMNGGVGAVPGVIIGVLIFILIQYGMNFIGINPYWQNVVKGALIVVAVAIDARKYAKRR